MKTIELYRFRKVFLSILFALTCVLILAYLLTEDWNEPNWTLLIALALNATGLVINGFTSYWKKSIQLHKDQIRFTSLTKKEAKVIAVNEHSEFSKDWKGIYVKSGDAVYKIPLEFMGRKEGERLFAEIRRFYGKAS